MEVNGPWFPSKYLWVLGMMLKKYGKSIEYRDLPGWDLKAKKHVGDFDGLKVGGWE